MHDESIANTNVKYAISAKYYNWSYFTFQTVHRLSTDHRAISELPETKTMTEEGDIVVTCIKGNDEPGLYMYQLVMKMGRISIASLQEKLY